MYYPSEIWLSDCSKSDENLINNDSVIICRQCVVVEFFDFVVFLLISLERGSNFITMSLLFPKL